jgi:hypothetical protein
MRWRNWKELRNKILEEEKAHLRFSHFSISVMQSWNSRMCLRRPFALRAPSWDPLSESVPSDAACTSSPAVKARSPAPVRRTARTFGSWESFLKIADMLSHILGFC